MTGPDTCANQVYQVIRDGEPVWVTCGEPIRPCPCGSRLHLMYCAGWVHALTGSHRCYWPDGAPGPRGAARPQLRELTESELPAHA
jgi:hypothetical protein